MAKFNFIVKTEKRSARTIVDRRFATKVDPSSPEPKQPLAERLIRNWLPIHSVRSIDHLRKNMKLTLPKSSARKACLHSLQNRPYRGNLHDCGSKTTFRKASLSAFLDNGLILVSFYSNRRAKCDSACFRSISKNRGVKNVKNSVSTPLFDVETFWCAAIRKIQHVRLFTPKKSTARST